MEVTHMTHEEKLQAAKNNVAYWQDRLGRYLDKGRQAKYRHASALQSALDGAKAYLAKLEGR